MGLDWDDLLAYTSFRRVRIRHKYVGGLYYFTMFLILMYTGVWQVYLSKGYLLLQPIVGSVRATIQQSPHPQNLTDLPYCMLQPERNLSAGILDCVSFQPLIDTHLTPGTGLMVGTRVTTGIQVSTRPAICAIDPYQLAHISYPLPPTSHTAPPYPFPPPT